MQMLKPFIDKPETLDSLSLSSLHDLRDAYEKTMVQIGITHCATASLSSQIDEKQKTQEKIKDLGGKIQGVIQKRQRARGWLLSIFFISLHMAAFVWIFAYQKYAVLPWYASLGTLLIWIFMKAVDRLWFKRVEPGIFALFLPQGIMLIPLITASVVLLIFFSPNTLGMKDVVLAKIIEQSPLNLSCGSTIAIGNPLSPGDIVQAEKWTISEIDCVRVATGDGRVGFASAETLLFLEDSTLKGLRYEIIKTFGITTGFVIILFFLRAFYLARILPLMLKRLLERQSMLLKKKIEEASLLDDFSVNDAFEIGLDIQEAKSRLTERIVERHEDQAQKIVASQTMCHREKEKMMAQLTQWTLEALKSK